MHRAERRVARHCKRGGTYESTIANRWSVYRIDRREARLGRIQWLRYVRIYIRISTRRILHGRPNVGGDFYNRAPRLIFAAPISPIYSRACGCTRFSPFSTPPGRRVHPFAPPSGAATLPAFATRSPISSSRSARYSATLFYQVERHPSLQSSRPPNNAILSRPSSICKAARPSLTPLQASCAEYADSRFAKRIQRIRVICFPTNSLRERIENAEENIRISSGYMLNDFRVCKSLSSKREKRKCLVRQIM